MTIRHLRIFIEVAERGKMSLAARSLFITQPSVSQAIRELEEHYQVLLFERLSKKLYITKEGEFFYEYAKQVVTQFDKMEEAMLSNVREKLRIGATASVCVGVLPYLAGQFQALHPRVDLYSFGGNTVEVERKIKNMELDAGIIEGQVDEKDLISIPMIEDYMVLAVGKDHPFAPRRTIHARELENQKFAIREQGSGSRALFENYLKRHQIKVKTVFEENSPTALISAVKMNGCMTVISVRLVEEEVRKGEISVFLQEEKEWNRHFCFVYHKDKYRTSAMKEMEKLVRNYGKEKTLEGILAGRLVND